MSANGPCRECPFRRAACPGWLGESGHDPVDFLNSFSCGEAHIPCHILVDWESTDCQELAALAPPCQGALVFLANQYKLPRNSDLAALVKAVQRDPEAVFIRPDEFCQHHLPGTVIQVRGSLVIEVASQ